MASFFLYFNYVPKSHTYLIPNSYIMKLISVLIASKLNAYICGDFSLMLSISAGLSLNIQNKSLSKLKQITGLESEYKVCSNIHIVAET